MRGDGQVGHDAVGLWPDRRRGRAEILDGRNQPDVDGVVMQQRRAAGWPVEAQRRIEETDRA